MATGKRLKAWHLDERGRPKVMVPASEYLFPVPPTDPRPSIEESDLVTAPRLPQFKTQPEYKPAPQLTLVPRPTPTPATDQKAWVGFLLLAMVFLTLLLASVTAFVLTRPGPLTDESRVTRTAPLAAAVRRVV